MSRSLGEQAVAYHAGSGNTHLLTPLSDSLLAVLTERGADAGLSPTDILDCPSIATFQLSERDVDTALAMLEEAGLVHGLPNE